MPLSIGPTGVALTVRVQFSKDNYAPDEPIAFQVVIEGEVTSVSRDVTVNGVVVLPGQGGVPVSGTTQVIDDVSYGTFAADGYDVTQDPDDPSRYTATPTA